MKSGDIAQKHAAEEADWQRRGMGGIVSAVDPAAGVVTVSSGAKKVQVKTTATTVFQRYAPDSVKFEDAKPGTLAQVQVGDQLEVRGAKDAEGRSIEAEEVVSGSFRNLSGTLATVNAAAGTVTLKDLTTKKMMTVAITANSDMRKLPPEMAAPLPPRGSGAAPLPLLREPRGRVPRVLQGRHPASPVRMRNPAAREQAVGPRATAADRVVQAAAWQVEGVRRAWTCPRC